MADKLDLVIRNATVIDGTRAPRFQADIAVSAGKISRWGPINTSSRFAGSSRR